MVTKLPFSTSGGSSSLTLPLASVASPTIFFIADCIDAGVARPAPGATVSRRPRSYVEKAAAGRAMGISGHAVEMLLIAQGRKIRYHIFDLFGAEHRLSL